jgi:hypothetical protein
MSQGLKEDIVSACGGNPGALRVLVNLYEKHYEGDFLSKLLIYLKLTATKASNIWVVYKDIAKMDLDKTHEILEEWMKYLEPISLGAWLHDVKNVEYAEV